MRRFRYQRPRLHSNATHLCPIRSLVSLHRKTSQPSSLYLNRKSEVQCLQTFLSQFSQVVIEPSASDNLLFD